MIHDIRNMTTYIEQFVMKMIVLFIYQKKRRDISQKHQKTTEKRKRQDEQLEMMKKTKISYQVDKFSEKIESKSKFLRMR